ncbi:MAG TPA: oligosaccharide flippase family protein [Polyangia bacterium]
MSDVGSPTQDAPMPSVKARTIRGALWTVFNQGASQVLRFGSNIVLTRFLLPEAFGLMSLVWVFIIGLDMLSDVGVGPAIIRSERGDDPQLLDTAWTVQIIRGFVLLGLSLLVAWPAARFYDEPRLVALISVAGLGIAIRGFTPTRVHSLNRKVLLGRLTVMELTCQATTIGIMILGAWLFRSVWALLIGTIAGDIVRVGLSYWILPGHKHRLHIDRKSVGEIIQVGRWIVVSTAVTYAVGYLDRMVIGRMLSITDLGIYAIAFQVVQGVVGIGRAVSGRVLFPVLSETLRQRPELLYKRLRRARLLWIVPTVAGLLVLCLGGDWLIRLVYKPTYYDAGWMLRILAAGSIAAVINQSGGVIWPTLGEFRTIVVVMVAQIVLSLACMFIGFALYGTVGFVVGVASVELLVYPVQAMLIARRKLWQPEVDLPVLALAALVAVLGAFFH